MTDLERELIQVIATRSPFSLITISKVFTRVRSIDITIRILHISLKGGVDPLELCGG